MAATEVPFDLVEVKLAEPLIRPATVAKRDVIEQLRTSRLPFASIAETARLIEERGLVSETMPDGWPNVPPRQG